MDHKRAGTVLGMEFPYLNEAQLGYMDFFSPSYQNSEPIILDDGTSVQFPHGWTDEDADKWRKSKDLQRPDGITGRVYYN